MKNKLFLTSVFVIVGVNAALADEDYVSSNSMCTFDVLNTYGGENGSAADLEADWELLQITCDAGKYLNKTTGTCENCTNDNYCLGGTYNVEMANTGLTQCSTIENGAYPYSFESANATTKCYRQCVATDVAHATSASGEYYYGGENTCEATGCAVGWTLKSINLQSLYGNQTNSGTNVYAYMSGNTPQFGSPHDSILSISEAEKQYYGITDSSKWAVKLQDYDMGIIRGEGRCLSTSGTVGNTGTPSISSSGTKCWCGITSYIEPGGTRVYNFLSTTWVYKQDFNGMSGNNYEQSIVDCSSNCAMVCAVDVGSDNPTSEYRSKLRPNIFRNMVSTTICDGNSIAIDWYNDTVANNGIKIEVQEAAQQCTYSGTITIPDEQHTPSKTGYTFGGWKLRTNE